MTYNFNGRQLFVAYNSNWRQLYIRVDFLKLCIGNFYLILFNLVFTQLFDHFNFNII
jgi:hypothetical protein